MPEPEIDLDLADIDTDQLVPSSWSPQQDELPFDAHDEDKNSND